MATTEIVYLTKAGRIGRVPAPDLDEGRGVSDRLSAHLLAAGVDLHGLAYVVLLTDEAPVLAADARDYGCRVGYRWAPASPEERGYAYEFAGLAMDAPLVASDRR